MSQWAEIGRRAPPWVVLLAIAALVAIVSGGRLPRPQLFARRTAPTTA